jgi:DNA-directed RNA polymerase specialized sigma subunit
MDATVEESASSTEWASALDEIGLWELIADLPRPSQKIIIGYFWKGQSFPVLARNMRISVSQVQRLFPVGLSGLKKRILAKNRLKKIFLASVKKGG